MNKPNREQMYGLAGTIVFHAIVLLVLLLVVISKPQQQPEAGVSVIMGNVAEASGDAYEYTEVRSAPQPADVSETAQPAVTDAEPLITQTDEPTVEIPSGDEAEKNDREQEPAKTPEQEAAEQRALEEERKRQEAERIAREAQQRIAGAFDKGAAMTDRGAANEGKGQEGSTDGNETVGVKTGTGGYGTFDLNGRTLGKGGLPRPEYNVQDEGRVVVNITVNPDGKVVQTSVNPRTNTANAALRRAALNAAAQAEFNSVEGVNNQMGTITYYFKLR